jgi:hypothetical protein
MYVTVVDFVPCRCDTYMEICNFGQAHICKSAFVNRHRPAYSSYTGLLNIVLPAVDSKFTPEIEPLLLNAKVSGDSQIHDVLQTHNELSRRLFTFRCSKINKDHRNTFGGFVNTPKCDDNTGDDAGRLRSVGACAQL